MSRGWGIYPANLPVSISLRCGKFWEFKNSFPPLIFRCMIHKLTIHLLNDEYTINPVIEMGMYDPGGHLRPNEDGRRICWDDPILPDKQTLEVTFKPASITRVGKSDKPPLQLAICFYLRPTRRDSAAEQLVDAPKLDSFPVYLLSPSFVLYSKPDPHFQRVMRGDADEEHPRVPLHPSELVMVLDVLRAPNPTAAASGGSTPATVPSVHPSTLPLAGATVESAFLPTTDPAAAARVAGVDRHQTAATSLFGSRVDSPDPNRLGYIAYANGATPYASTAAGVTSAASGSGLYSASPVDGPFSSPVPLNGYHPDPHHLPSDIGGARFGAQFFAGTSPAPRPMGAAPIGALRQSDVGHPAVPLQYAAAHQYGTGAHLPTNPAAALAGSGRRRALTPPVQMPRGAVGRYSGRTDADGSDAETALPSRGSSLGRPQRAHSSVTTVPSTNPSPNMAPLPRPRTPPSRGLGAGADGHPIPAPPQLSPQPQDDHDADVVSTARSHNTASESDQTHDSRAVRRSRSAARNRWVPNPEAAPAAKRRPALTIAQMAPSANGPLAALLPSSAVASDLAASPPSNLSRGGPAGGSEVVTSTPALHGAAPASTPYHTLPALPPHAAQGSQQLLSSQQKLRGDGGGARGGDRASSTAALPLDVDRSLVISPVSVHAMLSRSAASSWDIDTMRPYMDELDFQNTALSAFRRGGGTADPEDRLRADVMGDLRASNACPAQSPVMQLTASELLMYEM